jgi:hypothetical protein
MSDIPNVDTLGADGLPPAAVPAAAPLPAVPSVSSLPTQQIDQTAAESSSSLATLAPQVGQPSMAGSGVSAESVSHGIQNQSNTFLQSSLGSSTGVANTNAGNSGGSGTGGTSTSTGSAPATTSDQPPST